MERILSDDEVKHVADLAKISLADKEIIKYKEQLVKIIKEIHKIKNLKVANQEPMIFPIDNINRYAIKNKDEMLEVGEVLKNAPKTNGNYIEIAMVLND